MESNFYTDEFEQLLKEKADQFRMYPSRRVWHSIYNNLHPSRRWPSAVMSILLFFSLVFTGYLNTGDNSISDRFSGNGNEQNADVISTRPLAQKNNLAGTRSSKLPSTLQGSDTKRDAESEIISSAALNDDPGSSSAVAQNSSIKETRLQEPSPNATAGNNLIQSVDNYIKTNQIFTDAANANKKISITPSLTSGISENQEAVADENRNLTAGKKTSVSPETILPADKLTVNSANETVKQDLKKPDNKQINTEEKAWIENYAFQNKPSSKNKWKGRMEAEFYVSPAVNYRKLSVNSKGSTAPFANSDINRSISQKPGFGFETGLGLSYAFAKNLRLKAGVQFNYTNYNIDADQTNHPILTSVLMNDPATGYSYLASRTSSLSNSYNYSALQPVVLHNRTYQISIPVGLAYKLSSKNNVEWYAGATIQPTYVFGGNAHLLSSDLKSYISEPSSIRSWNLNLGFETYMSYKLGSYNLQVGPQVRYQAYSTYRRDVALIEKPYAVSLKIGIVKGF